MTMEDRLYNCFKKAFEEENGNLRVKLNESNIVADLAGEICTDEFLDEMYRRWLKEGNKDKGKENVIGRSN